MCLTPEKCLGARAWPNVIPHDERYEIPLLLWTNSTLGLNLCWWEYTLQQEGPANLKSTAISELPMLDPRELASWDLDRCQEIFDRSKDRRFLPANEAYRDETRRNLDGELLVGLTSVLQLDPGLEDRLGLLRKL